MTTETIRYIHLPHADKPRTIAYIRYEDRLLFAWSLLHPSDDYCREVGRVYSADRLLEYHDVLTDTFEENSNDFDKQVMFSVDERIGYISADAVRATDDVTAIIADHVVLNLKDFNHGYLTGIINRVVDAAIYG